MRKIIGIVPKGIPADTGNDRLQSCQLDNSYAKRIVQAGATPVCLAPVDGRLTPEQLALCDGFLVMGGRKMWPYHFQVIHHAAVTGKNYLGICPGMQLIHRYYALRELVQERNDPDAVEEGVLDLFFRQKVGTKLLHPVEGHRYAQTVQNDAPQAKHAVQIVSGTVLHGLVKKEQIMGASYHSYCVKDPVSVLTVNAWAKDGTVEGVENGSNILGVQFHPEVDECLPELFAFLTEP